VSLEPIRLRDDPASRPGLREDLARARQGAGAPYDEARGLARLQASLGGGPGSGGSPPRGPSGGGALRAIPWGSAAIGAGAAGIVLALWSVVVPAPPASRPAAVHDIESAAAAPSIAPLPSSIPVLDPRGPSSLPEPRAQPRAASPSTSAMPRNEARIDAPTHPPEPAPSAAKASSSSAAATLAEEVAHLARLRALAASDPASALALVEEGHHRFAGGALWLERETIAFGALMRLGRREEAATRGERILQNYPDSLNAKNIRMVLGQPQGR
jgi:hypothetical protein